MLVLYICSMFLDLPYLPLFSKFFPFYSQLLGLSSFTVAPITRVASLSCGHLDRLRLPLAPVVPVPGRPIHLFPGFEVQPPPFGPLDSWPQTVLFAVLRAGLLSAGAVSVWPPVCRTYHLSANS
ncbi:hypothetical protein NPIL_100701 [Nephila pilipes]|uniref:Uncharacterized protein n=1 Tax=Nephila pilipes TaxID=299642 RepID=A0A8X6UBR3_NEPPI|nr:hypothetical protein NPIL_100701 [Nephila pilipes]